MSNTVQDEIRATEPLERLVAKNFSFALTAPQGSSAQRAALAVVASAEQGIRACTNTWPECKRVFAWLPTPVFLTEHWQDGFRWLRHIERRTYPNGTVRHFDVRG